MSYSNLQQVTAGYEQKAQQLSNGQAWIVKAKRSQRREAMSLMSRLDTAVSEMPPTEKQKLERRFSNIIPVNARQFRRVYDDQFLDALVEVLGWDWLCRRYPSHTVQLSEPPDLVVRDDAGEVRAAMACKKIRASDKDRDYFQNRQLEVTAVKHSTTSLNTVENPFLRKLANTLNKAEEQLDRVNALDKYIFLNLSFDISGLILEEGVESLILRLAAELEERSIMLIAFRDYQVDKPITQT